MAFPSACISLCWMHRWVTSTTTRHYMPLYLLAAFLVDFWYHWLLFIGCLLSLVMSDFYVLLCWLIKLRLSVFDKSKIREYLLHPVVFCISSYLKCRKKTAKQGKVITIHLSKIEHKYPGRTDFSKYSGQNRKVNLSLVRTNRTDI